MKRLGFKPLYIVTAIFTACALLLSIACGAVYFHTKSGISPLIQFDYDGVTTSNENYIIARKDGSYGLLINTDGVYQEPAQFSYERLIGCGRDYVICKTGGHYGVLDARGALIIKAEYDSISYDAVSGLFLVSRNGQFGVMDVQENSVIPTKYEAIEAFHPDAGDGAQTTLFRVKEKNLYGVTNAAGDVILPTQYAQVNIGNYLTVTTGTLSPSYRSFSYRIYNLDGTAFSTWSYISPQETGNPEYPILASSYGEQETNPKFLVSKSGVNHAFDATEQGIGSDPEKQYDEIHPIGGGCFAVMKRENGAEQYGVVNAALDIAVPVEYDKIEGNLEEHQNLILTKGTDFFLVNRDLVVTPLPKYEEITFTSEPDVFRVFRYGKYGYIDASGAELIPTEYDSADTDWGNDGVIRVSHNGKFGIISRENNLIFPLKYDDGTAVSGSTIRLCRGGKTAFAAPDGTMKTTFAFDDLYSNRTGHKSWKQHLPEDSPFQPVRMNGNWGCVYFGEPQ